MTETLFDFGNEADAPETEASPTAAPPEPTNRTPDGLFDFGDTAEPTPVAGPRREITDPRGGPRVNQPPPRQWSVFGTPLPGTKAAEQGLEIHPLSRAVLQNFDLTDDISGNSAALRKIVRRLDEKSNPRSRLPVEELTDDQLAKLIDEPRVERALRLDSITRRRMAEDAEEAAILRGEIPFMLAAEGSVDTMVRMLRPPETRTPEAIAAQQNRGFFDSAANAIERGTNRPRFGLLISFAQSKAARGRAARGNPLQTFSDAFKEGAFGAEGSIQRKVTTIPSPIDLLYGLGQGVGAIGDVYLSGGYNEATASRLEKEAYAELEDAFRSLKRAEATTPMSRPATRFMQGFQELPDDTVGALTGFLSLLIDDPVGFTAASSEVLAEQTPILAASAVVRKPLGGVAAISTSALGTYASERFNVDAQRIALVKKKTGIDLNTAKGRADFLVSAEAQAAFSAYGKTRAALIATGVGVGGAYFRGGSLVPMKSLTGRFAEQTLVSAAIDGLFEAGAGLFSTGVIDVKEVLAEIAFGANPVSVSIESALAGRADYARLNDSKKAKAWLEGSTEIKGDIAGIPVVKLDTAASVMGEKLESEGIDTVYISAGPLFEQGAETARTLGLNPEDVARLAAEGGTVEVTAATFVRHILGKDGFDALIEHTMFDPAGMTPAEASEYSAAGIGDQIQQQLEERARNNLAPGLDEVSLTKLTTDIATIQDQVAGQLEATGRYDANKSRLFGLLTAQRYATRAIRLTEETGQPVDAAALFEADNLQIAGGQPAATAPTREAAPEGQIAVFDSEGNQQNLEVVARSEAGGVIVRLPSGEEVLLGNKLEVSDPLSSDFVVEGLPNAPRVSELSDPELASLEASRLERIAAIEAAGATNQGAYEAAKRDLTAARSELGRRRQQPSIEGDPALEQSDIDNAELELSKGFKDERIPELEEAARQRSAGEITQEAYDAKVNELKPIRPYTSVPAPATVGEMKSALKKGQQGRVGQGSNFVGEDVGMRLDIPAYTNHGTWVPTMHNPAGKPIAHEAAAQISDVVFTQPGDSAERKAARVGTGEVSKSPFAQMNGTLQSVDPDQLAARAAEVINDPEWTQVGYDPRRHTFFYDRATQQPVLAADEVIQVGPLVLAKNAQFGAGQSFLFQDAPDGALEQARATVQDPEALGLTEEEAARVNPIYRAGALPTKRLGSNEKAAKWLEEQFEGEAITDFTATLSTEQLDQLGRMMAAEVQLALESTSNAADWYSGAVLKAITAASIKYPMLTDDAAAADAGFGTSSNAQFAFTYIMAVTSQNLDVSKNSAAADAAFSEMVETVKAGDYSMKAAWGTGDKQAAMAKNFKKFKPMLDAMPGDTPQDRMAALDELFREKKTVKEWVVSMKAAGIPYSPPGNTAMDVVVYGSSTLGPKIGNGFWQNLNGNFDPLTIDLWMRRTWGRLTGKSIGLPSAIPAQRRRLKAAVAKSRSNEQGAPDLIDIARAELDTSRAAQADHTGQAETTNQTKKDFDAETRRLNKAVRDGEALLSDLAGLKAPETWKAEYGKDDDALLAYAKRLLKAWSVEYKSLQKKYDKGSIPDELQPTWARAAKAIRANLSTPLDQITNGTQRKQVEAAGARAIEILSERGIDVTTADMQALLWYPEKELWGALRDKLEVDDNGVPIVTASDLNESYDTAFARIFRSQGYEVEGIEGDGAGGSGQRAVAGQDARLVEPGDIRGAGQAGGAVESRDLFQEVDFVGDVIFEVAPDPNNVELSARWNALPPAAQLAISDTVSKSVLPSVLEAAGAEGSVSPQIGSYLDDTNPSFSLRLTSGDPAAVANAVGFVLSQDSMVALSADAFEGSFEAGAVWVQIGDKSLQEIDAIYQTLRGIEGFPQIGGQSTTDGQMSLILEEGVDPSSFAAAVDTALASEYVVEDGTVHAAFPEKKDYDYASETSDPAGSAGEARQRYRDVRDQAAQEVAAAIDQYERGGQQPDLEQQRGAAGPRGGFTPSDLITDQDGNPVNLLQIFEKADPTTFLHESGHFWLEQLKADALAVGGGFQNDFKAVTDWWASRPLELREEAVKRAKKAKDKDSVAALQQMTEAQVSAYARSGELRGEGPSRYLSVAMHEQFARGVENYFATGRAPSLSLAAAFSQFKLWVMSIYTKLGGAQLDVQFSPQVTAVIDRMLAADEEIALIEGQYNLAAMYNTAEQAGMTPTQFAAYQKKIAEAKDDRRARQLAKHVKELKRERTAWWKEERETLRDETSQEVAAEPAYRLLYALTNQGLADGSTLPEGEALDRMDRGLLKELLEADGFSLDDIPRIDSKAVYEADGLSPGVVAQAFGYEDVDSMILDLVGRQPYAQAVDAAIDAKMEEEHGSIEGSGEAEALASAYSDKTAQVLAAELAALRTTEPAFKQAFVRAYARDRLLEMPSAQVRPYRFLAAEKRHANLAGDALKRGDKVAAYQHQFQRLVNHYMATEALKAQRDIEKKTRYMRKFTKAGQKFPRIEAAYVDNILRILAAVNFGQGAAGQQSRANEIIALQQFIVERQEADGSILDVPDWLVNPTGNAANTVREMSYLQFLNLHETIKRYEQQGRAANKVRRGDEEASRAETKAELLAVLDGMEQSRVQRLRGKAASPEGLRLDDRIKYIVASGAALFDAQLLKVEALLEAIDGRPLGAWQQTIYEPFNKAAADKYLLQEEVSKLVGELIDSLPKEVRRSFGKQVDVGALGKPGMRFTRGNLIMMALNVGNESNLDKFIRGMGGDPESNVKGAGWNINEELVDAALDNLTEEEWNLVRGVWAHAEKLYPTVEGIYRREHGISPDRLEPRTVKTKFGEIKGGYFPMMYDRTIAGVAVDLQQKTALELIQGETGRASINSSMTKGRTGYAAPVDLDISRLSIGLDNTIHFITHYEAVRNANKILGDRDVRAELENKVGIAYTDQLAKWVAALAANGNDSPPVDIIQKSIQKLYTNTTVAVLGFSYSTLGMQTLGLFNGQDRLLADSGYGPVALALVQKDIAAGVAAAFRPAHVAFVLASSGEMQGRRKSMDREVSNVLRSLAGKEGVVSGAQRFSMQAIAEVQFYTVDVPVWTAGYNRALRGNVGGVDKGDTAAAIKYADRVVRLSQSAGGLKDLAAVQRHKGLVKGLTMFYSFFSALYAVLRATGVEFSQNVKDTPIASTSRAATRLFVLLALQSVASGLIRGDLPDWEEEDKEKEDMLDYIAKESLVTALGVIPVIRDIAAGAASGYGYSGGPGNIAFEALSKSMSGLEKIVDEFGNEEVIKTDGDYEDMARRYAPFILLFGAVTGAPAVQLNRTLDGLAAFYDEADNWSPTDLLRGYKPERAKRRAD